MNFELRHQIRQKALQFVKAQDIPADRQGSTTAQAIQSLKARRKREKALAEELQGILSEEAGLQSAGVYARAKGGEQLPECALGYCNHIVLLMAQECKCDAQIVRNLLESLPSEQYQRQKFINTQRYRNRQAQAQLQQQAAAILSKREEVRAAVSQLPQELRKQTVSQAQTLVSQLLQKAKEERHSQLAQLMKEEEEGQLFRVQSQLSQSFLKLRQIKQLKITANDFVAGEFLRTLERAQSQP